MFEEDFDIVVALKGLVAQAFYMDGAMVFGMLRGRKFHETVFGT
jgi:acyl CoA:acetate/3-ketoacid CoA transferase beta subunit